MTDFTAEGHIFLPERIRKYEVICLDQRGGQRDDEKLKLPVFGIFLCVFLMFGAVYRFIPLDGVKSCFPLLGSVSLRLDEVARELKTGSPISEAVEAFFHEGFTGADSD